MLVISNVKKLYFKQEAKNSLKWASHGIDMMTGFQMPLSRERQMTKRKFFYANNTSHLKITRNLKFLNL